MKKTTLVLLMAVSLLACKKEDKKGGDDNPHTCTTCTSTPEANAAYDNNSGGVYKGVVAGSETSGTLAVYLHNSGTDVKAEVTINGQHATLITAALDNWTPGDAVNNAVFTGTLDGDVVAATFSVDVDGANPVVMVPGGATDITVYKEKSTQLVKGFEGTFSGDDSGTFNMILAGNSFTVLLGGGASFSSTLVDGKIQYVEDGVEVSGSITGDNMQGTWKNDDGEQGTWTGKRTL